MAIRGSVRNAWGFAKCLPRDTVDCEAVAFPCGHGNDAEWGIRAMGICILVLWMVL